MRAATGAALATLATTSFAFGACSAGCPSSIRVIASSTPDHLLVQDRGLHYTMVVNPHPSGAGMFPSRRSGLTLPLDCLDFQRE